MGKDYRKRTAKCALKQACKSIEYVVDYEQPVEHGGAGMRFFDAGHVLGSSHVEIEIANKKPCY